MKIRNVCSYLWPLYDRHCTLFLVSLKVIKNLELDLKECVTITEYYTSKSNYMPVQKLAMGIMLVFDNNHRRKIPGGSVLKAWGA